LQVAAVLPAQQRDERLGQARTQLTFGGVEQLVGQRCLRRGPVRRHEPDLCGVYGQCHPTRDGAQFPAFLKSAVNTHAGKDIHVILDNLSTHTTPDVQQWLIDNPHVRFHFTWTATTDEILAKVALTQTTVKQLVDNNAK